VQQLLGVLESVLAMDSRHLGASHTNNMPYHESMLILASASLRRHELLLAAGIDHAVRAAEIVEERHPDEPPARLVERLA
jgi:hypothetical protein